MPGRSPIRLTTLYKTIIEVGDLRVEDIEGDKDLQLGVGDIRVPFGRAAYQLVRASTSIGDVNTSTGTSAQASSARP